MGYNTAHLGGDVSRPAPGRQVDASATLGDTAIMDCFVDDASWEVLDEIAPSRRSPVEPDDVVYTHRCDPAAPGTWPPRKVDAELQAVGDFDLANAQVR